MTPERMAQIHAAAFAGRDRAWPAPEIAAMLDRPPIHAVSLGQDGFAMLQILPPEAELLTIAITPVAQGKGLGRALLAEAMAAARRAGARRLLLEVAADNAAALALYAAAGFTRQGLRSGYYTSADGAAIDALVLGCPLGA